MLSLDSDASARGMREGKVAAGGGRAERAVRIARKTEGAAGRRLVLDDEERLMDFLPVFRIVLAVI